MVIIRCNALVNNRQAHQLITDIHDQARDGVVVIPSFCEVLAMEDGTDLQIIMQQTEDARVAELEKELAAAMEYINKTKDCNTCKHQPSDGKPECRAVEWDCAGCYKTDCKCWGCGPNANNWEWRGA